MDGAGRYPEIDACRGIAILMMLVFHTVYDLQFFRLAVIDVAAGFWRYFAFATAALFLLIVGISLTISSARAAQSRPERTPAQKFLLRGAFIGACGLLVSLGTYLYLGAGFVIFGILHLIGVSVMLSPFFFRFRSWNILAGLIVIVTGIGIGGITGPEWLLPLGIHPPGFWSVDYTPLFPWFGLVLVGMGTGEAAYTGGVRQFRLPQLPAWIVAPLSLLGRHSLGIYLLHQPIIILLLGVITGVRVL